MQGGFLLWVLMHSVTWQINFKLKAFLLYQADASSSCPLSLPTLSSASLCPSEAEELSLTLSIVALSSLVIPAAAI